jgi:hypothetical protein
MWWRRDPSLFSRSLINRYAQRVLRDDEAALRTRGYSRTPPNSAQQEHHGDSKRPTNMSNLEWMQLQHYERWRKRLQEDPYKTLFGASNDMLSGKGLGDWNWIHKTFPKWMLREMDVGEQNQEWSKEDPKYSKKAHVPDRSDTPPKARESLFPEPSFRKVAFEREASSGVVSPSDLRRPREDSHVKVVGTSPGGTPGVGRDISSDIPPSKQSVRSSVLRSFHNTTHNPPNIVHEPLMGAVVPEETEGSAENAINESKTWRQTALQRRAASEVVVKPPTQSLSPSKLSEDNALHTEVPDSLTSPQTTAEALKRRPTQTSNKGYSWLIQQESISPPKADTAQNDSGVFSPSSDKLKQLPQDDIDFLSAADIRASMGAKRSRIPTDEQRQVERQSLEKAFATSQETPDIDSMLQAKIINNQHIRRTEREMRNTQANQEAVNPEPAEPAVQNPVSEAPVQSSVDRMKRWLETTGASFAKQFWQDPTEEADVTKTKLYFDKVANYVKKGQAATKQIAEDLEREIPASIALLKRLRKDEEQLDMAIHRLRQRSSSTHGQGLSPRKIRAMESLKTRFHQTNNELEKAYGALRDLVGTKSVTGAIGSFKRRLTTASTVLHKNSQLLRMLIWSLQTRLEDSRIDRNILPNYKIVADNLLSLRDTQMTLMRLVDRAMLVYGVVPNAPENVDSFAADQLSGLDNCDDPFVRARLAADAHLIKEINAHNSTVQEHSHEPPSSPQAFTSTSFHEPNPLAHSLFRPFGPAIDKLGNKEMRDVAAEKEKENERMKLTDQKQVDEVKTAYENMYGTTNVEPSQTVSEALFQDAAATNLKPKADTSVTAQEQEPESTTKFEMLKDDPAAISLGYATSVASNATTPLVEEDRAAAATVSANATSAETEESIESPARVSVSSMESLPTHYTIVVRDPHTDTLSITTSTTGPPRDASPAVPLHQALSALDSPAKFIPYITSGLEVVSANKDILVLRDAIDTAASTRPFETIRTSASSMNDPSDTSKVAINPIDGTTRLSPTGYVGPDESPEQLEKEFQQRRDAASTLNGKVSEQQERPREEEKKAKRKGGAGGVVKTAIWVAGMCYVVGVVGEIYTPSI